MLYGYMVEERDLFVLSSSSFPLSFLGLFWLWIWAFCGWMKRMDTLLRDGCRQNTLEAFFLLYVYFLLFLFFFVFFLLRYTYLAWDSVDNLIGGGGGCSLVSKGEVFSDETLYSK